MAATGSLPTRLQRLALSPATRPLRFAGTGGAAAAVQLTLLVLLTHRGWDALLANAVAFLLAAQVNFALSVTVTWRDRRGADSRPGTVFRRWLLFHGSIAFMALVNMLVFTLARAVLPTLPASLAGSAAGAAGNYISGDRFVFRDTVLAGASAGTERRRVA
ncbi:MAG TPA: GtrA family protein [Chloroflexota bacterium]|nr:GtrA family protein [Chloroflexota bacterium]